VASDNGVFSPHFSSQCKGERFHKRNCPAPRT
jgi:hypothetical protein